MRASLKSVGFVAILIGLMAFIPSPTWAAAKNGPPPYVVSRLPVAPAPPRSALLTTEDWQRAPMKPLEPGEMDDLIDRELKADKITPAPLTTDEQFIRRISLDLTGRLPLPADVTEFAADADPQKREHLIDKLLASDDFARHWAHYWTEVISSRATEKRAGIFSRIFEDWLSNELRSNARWSDVATAMITASGKMRIDQPDVNGAAFFLAEHRGPDAANERAAETSRIFLGIQIQCAQCHDHPSDQWKRVQFHELAGYFARLAERPVRDAKQIVGIQLVSLARGEHEMPSREDPKKGFLTNPCFLDGKSPGNGLADLARRRSLASAIVNKDNYWFAAAFVNRVWTELMGQSFYTPVDDLGPQKEAVFPEVLTRLTSSFRAGNYDVKGLFREILSTRAYQRQIRLTAATDQHLHFAAAYPTRLQADAVWASLTGVLGQFGERARPMPRLKPGLRLQQADLESLITAEFNFDPSLKADEVKGSISQALLLMNNPVVQGRVAARGTNVLSRILKSYPGDGEALRMLYLRTLARTPTERELKQCHDYIAGAANREEAFEDILWSLLNSTEFLTKR
jgi:Protein of unknown function (DUF1549)/Protein of unknown function (DUF1553)